MWHGTVSVLGQSFDLFELIHPFLTHCSENYESHMTRFDKGVLNKWASVYSSVR